MNSYVRCCIQDPTLVMQSMQEFPPLHRNVVLWLLDFMAEIVQNAAVNKMTAKNLGTGFSLSLSRSTQ